MHPRYTNCSFCLVMKTCSPTLRISLAAFVITLPLHAELLTGVTTIGTLVTFDSSTPGAPSAPIAVTGLQAGETLLGIDRRPATGALYGLGSTSRLYAINPITGVATEVGSPGAFTLSGTAFGFDFNPVVDRIRVTSNIGQNIRLNPNDGTLSATDTPLNFEVGDLNQGNAPHLTGSAYSNNSPGAPVTTLYDIDSNLDILTTQGSPNGTPVSPNTGILFTVGTLGFNTSDLVGFDISGLSGVAYASMTAPGGNASQLFSINLSTGAATLVGTIGGGLPLADLAAIPGSAVPDAGSSLFLLCTGVALAGGVRRAVRL
jgi:hypothetical protein